MSRREGSNADLANVGEGSVNNASRVGVDRLLHAYSTRRMHHVNRIVRRNDLNTLWIVDDLKVLLTILSLVGFMARLQLMTSLLHVVMASHRLRGATKRADLAILIRMWGSGKFFDAIT